MTIISLVNEMGDIFGRWLIRIRKDGTIQLPRELGWEPGNMLEVSATGFDGVISMTHIRNQHIVNQRQAEAEKVR